MENADHSAILDQVPILYVRGTSFQIGLSMGRTFKGMIQDLFNTWNFFNTSVLPNYTTLEGKQIYDDALRLCEIKYPRYVDELRGLAEGAGVPFYKVFMVHIDSLATTPTDEASKKTHADTGCTSIICNGEEVILAQNEDAFPENVNRFYIVSAEVLDDEGNKLEKFTALTYAGLLSGNAMGYNENGITFSINTLVTKERFVEGTPRFFVTRALLGAKSHEEILKAVVDDGNGIGDGININICYTDQRDKKLDMYSIEVAPPSIKDQSSPETRKSQVSVRAVSPGETYVHCNRYLHLQVEEINEYLTSTINRHKAIALHPSPNTMQLIKNVMSDQTNREYPVFRRFQKGDKDSAKTVATGIFDFEKRKWSVYIHPPSLSEATVVLDMEF